MFGYLNLSLRVPREFTIVMIVDIILEPNKKMSFIAQFA